MTTELHPMISEFRELLTELQPTIEDDGILLVTFGSDGETWDWRTGDNRFTDSFAHYYLRGGVVELHRDSDCLDLAKDAFHQITEGLFEREGISFDQEDPGRF